MQKRFFCAAIFAMGLGVLGCRGSVDLPTGAVQAKVTADSYLGCFTDDTVRALPIAFPDVTNIDSCVSAVAAAGYQFAGLQWYGQCWGGDTLGYAQAPESDCNTPCKKGGTCGGAWRNSIYRASPSPYIGCYTDDSNRALPVFLGVKNSIRECRDAGQQAGYPYVGLQWYGECWVGNTIGYQLVDDSECNTPCKAGGMCGGGYRNSIYSASTWGMGT
jgi:hypothetical protein